MSHPDSAAPTDPRRARALRLTLILLVFVVVLAVFPLTPQPATDIKVLGYQVFAFGLLVLWLFRPAHDLRAAWRASAFVPLFLIFVGLHLAASFVSPNVGYSLVWEMSKWAALFILFLIAADTFYTPAQFWALVGAICLAVAVASLYGFAQYLGRDPFPWQDTTRMLRSAPATFGNPNFASHALAPTLVLAIGLATQRRGWWVLAVIPIFAGHFALTQTRGSLLGLAAASFMVLVALLVATRVHRPARAIALTFGALVLAAALGLAGVVTVANRTTGQPFPIDDSESITLRYHSFYGACLIIHDKPWLGHGPGMYDVVNPAYWTPLQQERFSTQRKKDDHVHNEPLEIAVNAGVPAAIAYIAILVLGVYYGLRLWFTSGERGRRRLGLTCAAFFLVFLIDGLFGFNLHIPVSAVLFFLIAGAMAGVLRAPESLPAPAVRPKPRRHLAWRVALLVCAALIPIVGIRHFAAQFWHQRGQGAMHYGAYAAADEAFAKAASLAPYHWLHPYFRGLSSKETGRPEDGMPHFDRALTLHPNFRDAQFRLAEAMFNLAANPQGASEPLPLEQVTAYAEQVAQYNPLLPEIHDLLGRAAYLHARRLTDAHDGPVPDAVEAAWLEAEQHLMEAIARESKAVYKLYHLIALARFARHDLRGAQHALIASIEDKPDELETWQIFQRISRTSGRYDTLLTSLNRRLDDLNRTRAASPNEVAALALMRAEVMHAGYGDHAGAEAEYLRVVHAVPARLEAWAALHAFAEATDRNELFTETLLHAARPEHAASHELPPLALAAAAGIQQGEEGIAGAVLALAEALQQTPAPAVDSTADVSSWAVDVFAARARQLELPAQTAGEVFLRLGLLYSAMQNFEAAAQHLAAAIPHLTDDLLVLGLLEHGKALTNLGNTTAAAKALEQAATTAPNNFEARYAFAQALARDGRPASARLEYRTILARFNIDSEGRRMIQQELDALPR
jgi:putative inorganic carbon (hco3(-)) transporter